MTINTIIAIVLTVVALAFVGVGLYFYLRDMTLEEIRADVYQLFLKAEHNPEFMESGKQKMKWVISQARMLLPKWLRFFITDEFLEMIVQGWFDAVKDLLDDGEFNGSGRAGKTR